VWRSTSSNPREDYWRHLECRGMPWLMITEPLGVAFAAALFDA
jgi:hypothetical protein